MANYLHQNDLPDGLDLGPSVAIDCETMGLVPGRDRLCLVQLSAGDGDAHLVQIAKGQTSAPNLERLLTDTNVMKLFHFGRFDIAAMLNAFGALTTPVYCTKIASKLVRTYTDRPWPEESSGRTSGHRHLEASADERLGRYNADRGSA